MARNSSNDRAGNSRKQGDSRADILRAAGTLFAEKGFEAVTVRDIAKEAGVGLPTIYHFFGDKQGLYRTVVLSLEESSGDYIYKALTRVHSIEDFPAWLKTMVDNSFDRREIEMLMLRELISSDQDLLREMTVKAFQPLYEAMRAKLNQLHSGAGDGVLPVFLLAATFGYVTLMPQRKFLRDYAPALDQDDLDAAERAAFIRHLQGHFDLPPTAEPAGAATSRSGGSDEKLLRAAVAELTLQNMKLRERVAALEAGAGEQSG